MRFIGDIHADIDAWFNMVDPVEESIQVGDFGQGFLLEYQNAILRDVDPLKHRYIRGNHDDPALCAKDPHWIKDGSVWQTDLGPMMFVGGAYSIDKDWRVPGLDWWEDEELSHQRLIEMIAIYEREKPVIMVTHDCPNEVALAMFEPSLKLNSRTGMALECMFESHQPDLWIFGHWHQSKAMSIRGTHFICLGINSFIDLELK